MSCISVNLLADGATKGALGEAGSEIDSVAAGARLVQADDQLLATELVEELRSRCLDLLR